MNLILKENTLTSAGLKDLNDEELNEVHLRIHKRWDSLIPLFKNEAIDSHELIHDEMLARNLEIPGLTDNDREILIKQKTEKVPDIIKRLITLDTPLNSNPNDLKNTEVLNVKLCPIDKKATDQQVAFGVVLEPDEIDSQNDTIPSEEIEAAAHRWLAKYQDRGIMHSKLANGKIEIYESYIAPTNLNINGQKVKKGTWLLMYHVLDDKLWKQIKSGEFTGFSMGGFARRNKV